MYDIGGRGIFLLMTVPMQVEEAGAGFCVEITDLELPVAAKIGKQL